MEIIRKIVFYIFLAAYLILCPLLILYSLGYVVDPLKEKLVSTGIIYLETIPPDAQVFLEKSHFKDKTPTTIHDLLPGTYTVRLMLQGYQPWTQTVEVSNGKAAAFEKIVLIPDYFRIKLLLPQVYTSLMPVRGAEYFLLSKSDRLNDYAYYDGKKMRAVALLPPGSGLSGLHVSAVFSRDESRNLVMAAGPLWDQKYWQVRLTGDAPEFREITKLVPERPLQFFWEADEKEHVFTLHHGYINRLDVSAVALYPRFVEDIRGWGISHDQLYVIDRDDALVTVSPSRNEPKVVLQSHDLAGIFDREKDFYEIFPLGGDVVAFSGSRGFVIAGWPFPPLVGDEPVSLQYNASHNRLLVWTQHAVGILDMAEAGNSARRAEGRFVSPQIRWVYRKGRDIRQCFWAFDGAHIVFRDGNKIFLLQPQSQGMAHVDQVASCRDGTAIFYTDLKSRLYFLGEQDGYLYSLDLGPKKEPAR
ncbi:MAG: PEGA domain-containing protein [Candidatus Omnitrophota bacterium]